MLRKQSVETAIQVVVPLDRKSLRGIGRPLRHEITPLFLGGVAGVVEMLNRTKRPRQWTDGDCSSPARRYYGSPLKYLQNSEFS
jgi:hypothetical protein